MEISEIQDLITLRLKAANVGLLYVEDINQVVAFHTDWEYDQIDLLRKHACKLLPGIVNFKTRFVNDFKDHGMNIDIDKLFDLICNCYRVAMYKSHAISNRCIQTIRKT